MSSYPVENLVRLARIKKVLGVYTDRELAEKLKIHQSQVTRMKKTGFCPVYKRLMDLFLNIIPESEIDEPVTDLARPGDKRTFRKTR